MSKGVVLVYTAYSRIKIYSVYHEDVTFSKVIS